MSSRAVLPLTPELWQYAADHSTPVDDVVSRLQERTAALGRIAGMQIGSDQGALLTLLTNLLGTRQALEIGTFTGYSSLCIGRGLAPGGRLLCCDISEEWTSIAREAWAQAKLEDRIELRLGDAMETIAALPADLVLDLVFIDADKPNYGRYLQAVLPRVRSGGLVLVDNTLWSGKVIDQSDTSRDTVALRAFNDELTRRNGVTVTVLPIGDGLTVIRKL